MSITKTGSFILTKEARFGRLGKPKVPFRGMDIGALLYQAPLGIVRGIVRLFDAFGKIRPFADPIAKTISAASKPITKGVAGIARATEKRPAIMLPILGALGYGAYKAPYNIKKSIIHTNPNYDVTSAYGAQIPGVGRVPGYTNVFRDIRYRSPAMADYYSKKNIYF